MIDATAFALDLKLADRYCPMLVQAYRGVRQSAIDVLGIAPERLPQA